MGGQGIEHFKQAFDPLFAAFLRNKIDATVPLLNEVSVAAGLEQTAAIFGEEGKRIRPYMLYLAYVSARGKDIEDAMMAGISIELQHAFALVQDDIIDRGMVRHGQQTVHETIRSHLSGADAERIANAQAMLIGDLLSSWSYAAMHTLTTPRKVELVRLLQQMVERVIIGEMMDVSFLRLVTVTDADLSKRDALKTASYTFTYPTLIGMNLAGKDKQYRSFCEQFGHYVGEAYQIQDDVLDVIGEVGEPGGSDITEHQHTYLTQYIRRRGDQYEMSVLDTFFSDAVDTDNEQEVLRIVSQPDVLQAAQAEIERCLRKAHQVVHEAGFSDEYTAQWLGIVELLERRSAT